MDEQTNQPGQVITPHSEGGTPDPVTPGAGAPQPDRPLEQPEAVPGPAVEPEPGTPPDMSAPVVPRAAGDWQYTRDSGSSTSRTAPEEAVAWTASEFIAHEKSARWYVTLAVAAVAIAAGIYFVTGHDKFSTGIVLLVALFFGIYAARRPRVLQYALSRDGVHVGAKMYHYQDFKSFSVTEEGAVASVVFMPLKRFVPPLTIYLAPEVEDAVLQALGEVLPLEAHRRDAVDGFLKRIRF